MSIDMDEDLDKKIEEIVELYDRAQEEHKASKEREYWQGRKDGLRAALAILEPEQRHWEFLQRSSYGFRDEEWLVVKKFMEDARYNIADILLSNQEGKKIHVQTKINLIQWLDQYDRMSKNGTTIPVDNAVDCVPNFRWKLR